MGLRSLYFVVAGVMNRFYYLRPALGLVLGFVGVKMLLAHTAFKIGTGAALGVVAAILGVALIASWGRARKP
jgi:tellurite resistance protein TerC